ncbi:hypothetical protein HDE_12851 [Halotydeus destructor]|nr:hypothetical protein HDE_12851 [Halotydeus destructor]
MLILTLVFFDIKCEDEDEEDMKVFCATAINDKSVKQFNCSMENKSENFKTVEANCSSTVDLVLPESAEAVKSLLCDTKMAEKVDMYEKCFKKMAEEMNFDYEAEQDAVDEKCRE